MNHLSKFQRKYKEMVEEKKLLEVKILGFEAEKTQAVNVAVAAAVAPMRQQIQQLNVDVAHRDCQITARGTEIDHHKGRITELEAQLGTAEARIAELEAANAELQSKLQAQEPRVRVAEEKAEKLVAELKHQEAKMSRRQRERIAAIENRKVIAGAKPAQNRR